MTNDLTLDAARSLTDAELARVLASALADAAHGFGRACVVVAVMRERGITLPRLPASYLHAEAVAAGTLSARAALAIGKYVFLAKALIGLPHDLQDRLAEGEKIKIAVRVGGRIQSAERSILEMEQMQLRVAFTDGQVTPWEQQGEWLLRSGYEAPNRKPRLPRFNAKTGEIGGYKIEAYMQAFAAAGYQIVPIYKNNRLPASSLVAVVGKKGD